MIDMKCPFRQGYEKPLHYPCTLLIKLKPGCSYDKRLYCDIFSLYYKCEKEWDMGDLTDKIEWWCYATDFERYITQLQKDLEITRKALDLAFEMLKDIKNDPDTNNELTQEIADRLSEIKTLTERGE